MRIQDRPSDKLTYLVMLGADVVCAQPTREAADDYVTWLLQYLRKEARGKIRVVPRCDEEEGT